MENGILVKIVRKGGGNEFLYSGNYFIYGGESSERVLKGWFKLDLDYI